MISSSLRLQTALALLLLISLFGCQAAGPALPTPVLKEPSAESSQVSLADPSSDKFLPPAATYYYSVYNWLSLRKNLNDHRRAMLSLEMAVKADPDSSFLRLELADNLLQAGKVDEALIQASNAFAMEPRNLKAQRLLATIYGMSGKTDQAIAMYEKILEDAPADASSVFYLVSLYVESLNYEKALSRLREYRDQVTDDPLGPFYQGKVYVELKLYQEAEKYFKEALELEPEMVEAWHNLALIYEFTERRGEAAEVYRRLLDLDPQNRQVLERLGQLLVSEGKLDEGLGLFQRLRDLGQASFGVKIKIALIHFQQGDYEKAVVLLKELHTENPKNCRVMFYLASSLEAMDEREQALPLFLAIAGEDELFYDARIHAAFIYEEEKAFGECEKILRELIASYTDRLGLYRMLSSLKRKQDDYAGALEVLQAGLKVNPEDYKLRFALGVVYSDLKRLHDSIEVMQGLLKEKPDDATVLNFIGYTYVELGVQLDDAEKLLNRALELKPESGYIIDSLGWLSFVRQDYETALRHLLRAAELVEDDPVIYDHLGDIYQALGRDEEALQSYRRSLEIREAAEVREKIEKMLQKAK